jgi:hypothetical protein
VEEEERVENGGGGVHVCWWLPPAEAGAQLSDEEQLGEATRPRSLGR